MKVLTMKVGSCLTAAVASAAGQIERSHAERHKLSGLLLRLGIQLAQIVEIASDRPKLLRVTTELKPRSSPASSTSHNMRLR